MCTRISNRQFSLSNANVDHFSTWHLFLIDKNIHGPAINFAIHKAANATSAVLVLVQASNLSQHHKILDQLKAFLQYTWELVLPWSGGNHGFSYHIWQY